MAFKMKGSSFYGAGNQSKSPGKMYDSPAKLMGLVKNKVNKELDTPAGKAMASAATGGADKYASPAKKANEKAKVKVDMNNPKVKANYNKYKDNPKYREALDKRAGGKFDYDEKTNTSTTKTDIKK